MTTPTKRTKPSFSIVLHLVIYEEMSGEDMATYLNLIGDLDTYLEFLAGNPDVEFSFELSGAEANYLREKHPEILNKMKQASDRGQIDFVEGSYSQPHFHVLSSEPNIRQFEYGLKTLNDLFGKDTNLYIRQETAFHDQLPQILNSFGYAYASAPGLGDTIYSLRGVRLDTYSCCCQRRFPAYEGFRTDPLQGNEVIYWLGLDGSKIRFIITLPKLRIEDAVLVEQYNKFRPGQTISTFHYMSPCQSHAPPVEEIRDNKESFEFKKISDFVAEYIDSIEPMGEAEIYSPDSFNAIPAYGLLHQTIGRKAENKILQAEVLSSFAKLLGKKTHPLDEGWKKILAAQHHDNRIPCTPKAIGMSTEWCNEAIRLSADAISDAVRQIAEEIDSRVQSGMPIVVFNTLSWPRKDSAMIELTFKEGKMKDPELVGPEGENPSADLIDKETYPDGSVRRANILWQADVPAFGYAVYTIRDGGRREDRKLDILERDGQVLIRNDSIELSFDKTAPRLTYIRDRIRGNTVFHERDGNSVGELKCMIDPDGDAVAFRGSDGQLLLQKGNNFASVRIFGKAKFGSYLQEYRVGPETGRVDIDTRIQIANPTDIGNYHEPETQLRMVFPFAIQGNAYYDIPFGVRDVIDSEKFYAVSWTAIENESTGGIIVNQGSPETYLKGGILSNPLLVSNKRWSSQVLFWLPIREFDTRFVGQRDFHHTLFVYRGGGNLADPARRAAEVNSPLIAFPLKARNGKLSKKQSFIGVEPENVNATALVPRSNSVLLRVYEASGRPADTKVTVMKRVKFWEEDLRERRVSDLAEADETNFNLSPWKIKNLALGI